MQIYIVVWRSTLLSSLLHQLYDELDRQYNACTYHLCFYWCSSWIIYRVHTRVLQIMWLFSYIITMNIMWMAHYTAISFCRSTPTASTFPLPPHFTGKITIPCVCECHDDKMSYSSFNSNQFCCFFVPTEQCDKLRSQCDKSGIISVVLQKKFLAHITWRTEQNKKTKIARFLSSFFAWRPRFAHCRISYLRIFIGCRTEIVFHRCLFFSSPFPFQPANHVNGNHIHNQLLCCCMFCLFFCDFSSLLLFST